MRDNQSASDLLPLQQELETDVNHYLWEIKGRRWRHGFAHNALVVASISLSGAITVVGMLDQGTIAAILGVFLSALLALQQVFPFGDLTFFYRCGIADIENLQTSLKFTRLSQAELDKAIDQFKVIRKHLAEAVPRGSQAINTIMTMRDELKGIQ